MTQSPRIKLGLVSYMLAREGQLPLGLLTLAQIAREEGIEDVRVLDLPERHQEEPFIESLLDCDVVGFSSICSTYHQTIRLCRQLKAAHPRGLVVLGGPQASLTVDACLAAFPAVDVIFEGEAEHSWRKFLQCRTAGGGFRESTPGIAWRQGSEIRHNPAAEIVWDLSELPMPAFDLYDISHRISVTPVEIGRGCPFACSFCATSPFFRRRFRLKPIPRILAEMDRLHDLFGCRTFYFVQDSFSNKRSFVEEVCRVLRQHPHRYVWYCSARTDQVDEDLLAEMKRSGCAGVYFGLETGSQRMQKVIDKRLDIERAVGAIQSAAGLGLQVTTSMILGFPQETVTDLRDTLRVYLNLKASGHELVQLHVLAPLPGSKLMQEGHALCYDAMPSDFSDTRNAFDRQDGDLVQKHREIFTSFWYFVNAEIPRQRFLFVAHTLSVASLYFPNALQLAAQQSQEQLIERLLDFQTPRGLISDPAAAENLEIWVESTGRLLAELVSEGSRPSPLGHALDYDLACNRAQLSVSPRLVVLDLPTGLGERPGRRIVEGLQRGGPLAPYVVQRPERAVEVFRLPRSEARRLRVSTQLVEESRAAEHGASEPDIETLIHDICGPCGECCFGIGGILCGRDEWPAIRRGLGHDGPPPEPEPLPGSGLLQLRKHRYCVELDSGPRIFDDLQSACAATPGGSSRVRRLCPGVRLQAGQWRCSIEDVKPAGCVAYPLRLLLRENPGGTPDWFLSLTFGQPPSPDSCPLEAVLRRRPDLMDTYCERIRSRIGDREGTFALAAYNRSRQGEAAQPQAPPRS